MRISEVNDVPKFLYERYLHIRADVILYKNLEQHLGEVKKHISDLNNLIDSLPATKVCSELMGFAYYFYTLKDLIDNAISIK